MAPGWGTSLSLVLLCWAPGHLHVPCLSLSWQQDMWREKSQKLQLVLMWPSLCSPRSLDLTGPLLLGGVPDLPENFPIRMRHFVGCMRNLQVDSRRVDMADFIANNGTMPGMGARVGRSCVWSGDASLCESPRPLQPPPVSLISTPGCPTKKNVCDSNTCHNGGTCVNQWDSFSCECPLGFGGKSCAQGRRLGPWCCLRSGDTGRVGTGSGQGIVSMCDRGWKGESGQSLQRVAPETKDSVRGRPRRSAGRAWGR